MEKAILDDLLPPRPHFLCKQIIDLDDLLPPRPHFLCKQIIDLDLDSRHNVKNVTFRLN